MPTPLSPSDAQAPIMPELTEKKDVAGGIVSRMAPLRNWIHHRLGVDRAIAFTVLGRGWASIAGLVTVALIARLLTPAQQGYYYTFGSLVALQIVFELGFSFVILQMASHERAHLTIAPDGSITGDPVANDRLASVLQKTVRWYTALAALLAAFLLVAGAHFFSTYHRGGEHVLWRLPWYADVLAATFTFQLDPLLSFMEGCGFVANVARTRLVQAVVGSSLAWLALASHHGLFAPAMVIGGYAVVALIWLLLNRRLLLSLLRRNPGNHRIDWMKEVWGFQWRIAISWLCGYFIFQLYNPVLFAYHGAVVAGQMGMSLSLSTALTSVAVSWVNTKAAPIGAMIARKQYAELDRVFFRALKQACAVSAAGALVAWLLDLYLNWAHLPLAHRLLDPVTFGILLAFPLMNVISSGQGLYLRAHKQEKFLGISVLSAILVGGSTLLLGRPYGAIGVVMGSFLSGLLIGTPLCTYTFFKYRRIWHEA